MNVLVLGGGDREHALAWRLAQSPSVRRVFASPGNPGIAQVATCLPGEADPVELARRHAMDVTVVGPEVPLIQGVVDRFRAAGLAIVGPTAAAARLEGSKSFAKAVMQQAGVPTARYLSVSHASDAFRALDSFPFPVVLKADGLAAGKGVVIAHTRAEAERAVPTLFGMGGQLIVEEFLTGEEVSFIALTDGERVVPFDASQDHKTLLDNDRGPNTGGMGAYSDGRILAPEEQQKVVQTVMEPMLRQMAANGTHFTGFLYAGLMMTPDGPRVLEFNVRLGDPETQALLHRLSGDLGVALHAASQGDLSGVTLPSKPDPSVCVVLAAQGYPGTVRTGDPIKGMEAAEALGAAVFHAGTRQGGETTLTAGGRVLGVTASGTTLQEAITRAYDAADRIHFDGLQRRSDIGEKGLRRWSAERPRTLPSSAVK